MIMRTPVSETAMPQACRQVRRSRNRAKVHSATNNGPIDGSNDPLAVLEDEGFRDSLIAAIHHLPERERSMMGMYYEQDMNLKEIGAVLGVSESRVCQLHSQAVARLRAQLKIWKD